MNQMQSKDSVDVQMLTLETAAYRDTVLSIHCEK